MSDQPLIRLAVCADSCGFRGKKLTIEAKGNFTQAVCEGATVHLVLKYGLITLIRKQTDLCEQMKQVDEECPLGGEKALTKEVDIPHTIPPVCRLILASYSALVKYC